MNETRLRELLDRGGSHRREGAKAGDPPTKYNSLVDPAGADELARQLADQLRPFDPTAVVVWEDPEDVVLGHVVGRELGLPVIRAYDADGLVGHGPGLPAFPRLALVIDAVRDPRAVRAIGALASREGGSLVATAVLVRTSELGALGDQAGTPVVLVESTADGA